MSSQSVPLHHRKYGDKDPKRRMVGWAAVIIIHIFVLWALISGTARKSLEIIKKPLEAAVIQEVIIPPPPPPPPPPPKEIRPPEPRQPKVQAPPPPFVPPPEVTPPPSAAPAIVSMPTPPPAPVAIAPPPSPAPAPAPAAPAGRQDMGVACPTQVAPEMPRQALRENISGVVRAQATIRDGAVKDVQIMSGPRVFHPAVRAAMMQYKCVSGSGDVIATQEFVFKIE